MTARTRTVLLLTAMILGALLFSCHPRALCNRLWYCLCGFAVVALGKPPLMNLSPASAGLFLRASPPALCATNGVARRWGGRLAADGLAARRQLHQTVWTNLAPLPGGAFSAKSPLRNQLW